ncbi:ArnT family glycosyltransferase [Pseudonocardia xinjiangensis]|uniref:Glycosyltransferase family 39 protein n=1 Tax=Pseudonocardia xinjiangensis TaxID=75289 RepID=A0ABX1RNU9_9PSEU|nr:glycosyltransferase family 39 protein [Pseudonocardia xinjiangensis]NMH82053.1 glycosyltransferase family 39 protein [Pseudonocardia xinjiangensis]
MTTTLAPADPAPVASVPPKRRHERLALGVLLAATAVLYLWDLGASGFANSFYAAAVESMTRSWKAFFFASFDAGNIITVDKPPAALWVMALSGRIFGFSSWSMLVPEALMGVATVALIYAAVRRVSGHRAGLLAGTAMALTPVAALMFRFNNPDALLVLLIVAAAYATVRAVEVAGTRWLVLAGALVGFAFLAKMGQALVVVPALALAYLVAAPTGFWRRIRQLLAAGVALVVAAGWWVATVELWPAADRPYIGGSQTNSVLELALGYNGLGRIFGGSGDPGGHRSGTGRAAGAGDAVRDRMAHGAGGGMPPGADMAHGAHGAPGGGGFGGGAGLARMFGTDVGAQVSWLLPAALALLVIGLWLTRRAPRIDRTRASLVLWGTWTVVSALVFSLAEGIFHSYYTVALAPGIAALVGIGGYELWRRRGSWVGRLALALVVAGTAAWAVVLLDRSPEFLPWLRWVVAALGVLAVLALLVPVSGRRRWTVTATVVALSVLVAPAAYAVDTAATPHTGSLPAAGPPSGIAAYFLDQLHKRPDALPLGIAAMVGGPAQGIDPELVSLLQHAGTEWSAASIGSQVSSQLALASGTTVMAIGGFYGSDPAPTLEQFQRYVAAGQVHYFFAGGFGGERSPIATWVQDNFSHSTIGGQTVYDLTRHTH